MTHTKARDGGFRPGPGIRGEALSQIEFPALAHDDDAVCVADVDLAAHQVIAVVGVEGVGLDLTDCRRDARGLDGAAVGIHKVSVGSESLDGITVAGIGAESADAECHHACSRGHGLLLGGVAVAVEEICTHRLVVDPFADNRALDLIARHLCVGTDAGIDRDLNLNAAVVGPDIPRL